MISYLLHKQIDKKKWDVCISTAVNGLIYAKSYYLDNIANNWDALILNDYEAVMPLTWRRKFGIPYLYQPPFTQQLGIFFKELPVAEILDLFTAALQKHYKFAEIYVNYCNTAAFYGLCTARTNYVLNIDRDYAAIYNSYEDGFTKSLRRIAKFKFQYKQSHNITEAIVLYQNLYGQRVLHLSKKDYRCFIALCFSLLYRQQLFIRQVTDAEGRLLALSLLFADDKRLYNIISCVTDDGRRLEANYFLYDNIIKEFCEKGLVLDLEGSDIKGVGDFYTKMNPKNEPYAFLKYNHLHPLLRLVKK